MWKEEIMLEFEEISRHTSEGTEENYKTTQIQYLVSGQRF
jgi:hypothetical protein